MSKERIFRFKKFSVSHAASAIPIGIDAVLLGAWANIEDADTILDVGTGCGVIALMCAQRNPSAHIIGVDIHLPSVEEARMNFHNSQWADRLWAHQIDFINVTTNVFNHKAPDGIDLIISNPPFYNTGVNTVHASARIRARHTADFGPIPLLRHGTPLLAKHGSIALITPAEQEAEITELAYSMGLHIHRTCRVSGKQDNPPNRVLLQIGRTPIHNTVDSIAIYDTNGDYTAQYRELTKAFYLKF